LSVPIADLAALLMSHGLSSDVVRSCLELAEQHAAKAVEDRRIIGGSSADVVRSSSDTSAERRKEYDRKRQAEIRRLKRLSEKPPLILTSSLSTSEEILSEERKKESSGIRARARKKLGPLPENWQPPDIAYPLATECGTTVLQVDAIFRDYLKSSGKLYADHDAAFCNFVRNQRKFNGQPQGQGNGRRTVHDAAKDLHEDLLRRAAQFDEPAPSRLCSGEGTNALRLIPPRGRE